jgi:hypothetical protein
LQPSWLLPKSGDPRCPSWLDAEGDRQFAGDSFIWRLTRAFALLW